MDKIAMQQWSVVCLYLVRLWFVVCDDMAITSI